MTATQKADMERLALAVRKAREEAKQERLRELGITEEEAYLAEEDRTIPQER